MITFTTSGHHVSFVKSILIGTLCVFSTGFSVKRYSLVPYRRNEVNIKLTKGFAIPCEFIKPSYAGKVLDPISMLRGWKKASVEVPAPFFFFFHARIFSLGKSALNEVFHEALEHVCHAEDMEDYRDTFSCTSLGLFALRGVQYEIQISFQ